MIDLKEVIIVLEDVESTESEDIRRCLTALYSVHEGEQPLDRKFGISQEFLDQPVNIAKNLLALEIIEKTQRYESRVMVKKVDYQQGGEGILIPIVYLKRGDTE